MTNCDLETFIDWEGGIYDAIQHGRIDAIEDPKAADAWEKCVAAAHELRVTEDALFDLIAGSKDCTDDDS